MSLETKLNSIEPDIEITVGDISRRAMIHCSKIMEEIDAEPDLTRKIELLGG